MNPLALIVGYCCVLAAAGPTLFFAMSHAGILARPFYRRHAFYLLGICGFMTLSPVLQNLGQTHGSLAQCILLALHMAIMATMGMAVKDYHPGLLPGGETRRKWGTWFVLGTLAYASVVSMIFLRAALGMAQRESGETQRVEWNHYGLILVMLGWMVLYTDCKRQKVLLTTPAWTVLTLVGYLCSVCGIVFSISPFLPTSKELFFGNVPAEFPTLSLLGAIVGLSMGLVQFAWLTRVWASLGSLVMMLLCFCAMYHLFLAQWALPWIGLSGAPLVYLPLIAVLDRLTQWAKEIDHKRHRIAQSMNSVEPSNPSLAENKVKLSQPLGLLTQILGVGMVFLAATGPVSTLGQFDWISGSLWSLDTGFMASIGTYGLYLLVTWFVSTQPTRGYLGLGCLFLLLLFGKPFIGTEVGTITLAGFSLVLALVGGKGTRWHESHRTLQITTDMAMVGFLVSLVQIGYRLALEFEAETKCGFLSERLFLCAPLDALSLVAISLTAALCGFRYRSILIHFCVPISLALLFMPQLGILGLLLLVGRWALDRKLTNLGEKPKFPVQKFLGRVSLPLPTETPVIAIYWALTVSLLPLTVIGFILDSTLLLQLHGSPLAMVSLIASASIMIFSSFILFNPKIYLIGLTGINLAFLIITCAIQEKAGLSVWAHAEIPLLVFSLAQLVLYFVLGRLLARRYPDPSPSTVRTSESQAFMAWSFHQIHLGFSQFAAFLGLSLIAAMFLTNPSLETSLLLAISASLIGILHGLISSQSNGSALVHAALISFAFGVGILLNANQIPLWETANIIAIILMIVMIACLFLARLEQKSPWVFADSRWLHAAGHLSLVVSFLHVLYSTWNLNGWGNPGFPPNPMLGTLGTFGLICLACTFVWRQMPLMLTGLVANLLVLHSLFQRILETKATHFLTNPPQVELLNAFERIAHGGLSLAWIALFLAVGWWVLFRKVRKNDVKKETYHIGLDQVSWCEFLAFHLLKVSFLGTLLGLAFQSIELFPLYQTGDGNWSRFCPEHALLSFGYGLVLWFFAILGQTRLLVHLAGGAVFLGLVFLGQNQGHYPLDIRGAIHGASILGLILGTASRFFPSLFRVQFLRGKVPHFLPIPGNTALSDADLVKDHSPIRFAWATAFLLGSLISGLAWIDRLGVFGILPVLYLTCCGFLLLFGSASGTSRWVFGIGGTILGYGAVLSTIWWVLPAIYGWRIQGIPDIQMFHLLLSILTAVVLGIISFWQRNCALVGAPGSHLENPQISYLSILSGFNLAVTLASFLRFLGLSVAVQCLPFMENPPVPTSALAPFQTFLVPAPPDFFTGCHALIISLVLLAHAVLYSSGLALSLCLLGIGLTIQYWVHSPLLGPSILASYGLALCVLIPVRGWLFERADAFLRQRFLPWPPVWETIRSPLEIHSQSWQRTLSLAGLALTIFPLFPFLSHQEILKEGTPPAGFLAHLSRNDWIALAMILQCISWALLSQYRWIPNWAWFLGTTLTLTLASYPLIALFQIQTGNPVTPGSLLGCGPVLDGFALVMLGIGLFLVQSQSREKETGKSSDTLASNLLWIFSTVVATLGWFHSLGYVALYGSQSPTAGWVNLFCLVIPLVMLPRVVGSLGNAVPMKVRYEYLVVAILAPWISGLFLLQTHFGSAWIVSWTLGYAMACGLGVLLLGKSGGISDKGEFFPPNPAFGFTQGWDGVFLSRVLFLPLCAVACFLPWLALSWQIRDMVDQSNVHRLLSMGFLPLVIEAINLGIIASTIRQKPILIGALWVANLGLVSLFGGYVELDFHQSMLAFVMVLHLGLFTLARRLNGSGSQVDRCQEAKDDPNLPYSFMQHGIATWAKTTALGLLTIAFLEAFFKHAQAEFTDPRSWINLGVAMGLMLAFGRFWSRKSSSLWFHGFTLSLVHFVLTGLIFLGIIPSLPLVGALYAWVWVFLVAWKHPEEGWIPLIPISISGKSNQPHQTLDPGSEVAPTSKTIWARGMIGASLGLTLFCAPLPGTHPGNTSLSLGILSLAWLTRWMIGRFHLGRRFPSKDRSINHTSSGNGDTLNAVPTNQPDFGWLLFLGPAISLFVELPFHSGDFLALRVWMLDLLLTSILVCHFLYMIFAKILPVPSWDQVILHRLGSASVIAGALSLIPHFLYNPVQENPVQSLIWIGLSTAWIAFASMRYLIPWGIYLAYLGCGLICLVLIHRILHIPIKDYSWDATALIISSFFLYGISLAVASIQKPWSCLLGDSAFRLSVLLPAGILAVFPMAYPGPILVFLVTGSFYLFLNLQTGNRWFLYLSAVLINIGIYWGMPSWSHSTGLSQLYVIPAAITLLIVSQVHRKEFSQRAMTGTRYVAATAILAASTGEFYLSHQGALVHFVLVLLATLALIVLGIALKIRPFLFLGTGFLLVNVLGQLGSTLLLDTQGLIRAGILIALGLSILGIMVFFNSRRSQLIANYRSFMEQPDWE